MSDRRHCSLLTAYCLLAVILLPACASTKVYNPSGKLILHTQANAKVVDFHQGDTSLHMEDVDHSTPTRAGGSVIGTAATGLTAVATAVISKGVAKP